MFTRRVVFQPQRDKIVALSEALTAANTPANPIGVSRRLFGPTPQIVLIQSYEDMAAYEHWLNGFTPNPAVTSLCTDIAGSLWEVRVRAPAPANGATGKFVMRNTFHAASLPALRELLSAVEQRIAETNAAGGASSVSLNVFGDPRAIAVTRVYASLAEVERARATLAIYSNDDTLAYAQRIAPLLAPPVASDGPDLLQILVSMPLQRAEPALAAGTRA